jgi:stage IV sporulation protein FB
MSWRDAGRWSDDDPDRRLGGPGGDWRGLRPSLDNPMTWSVRIGRVAGIDVRVHVIFIIFVVVEMLRALGGEAGGTGPLALAPMAVAMAALFVIVLLHEFGHCFACRAVAGTADEILMWPLGGLAFCLPPNHWRAHLATALGGPAVNAVLLIALTPVLGLSTGMWWGVAVPNPFDFGGLYRLDSWPLMGLYIVAQLNLVLLLFNLLPIFPLDGGRIAQALLWPKLGYVRSMRYAVRAGYVGAIGLIIAGLVLQQWMLVGIAFFGGITCWITHKQLQFTQETLGFAVADEPPEAGPSRRQRRRAERRARREADEHRRVDAILHKIHESGLQSLTRAEKRLLERTTRQKRRSPPNR